MTKNKEGAYGKGANLDTKNNQSHDTPPTKPLKGNSPPGRFIEVDFSEDGEDDGERVSPERAFLAIRNTYLNALALDRRKKDILQVAQMSYAGYDPNEQTMTIMLPPGFSEPKARLVKELVQFVIFLDFQEHIKSFKFIPSDKLAESHGRVVVERPHKMQMKMTDWLWPGYIPLGRITILAGDPGIGKSQTSIDLAACITRGKPMPDGTEGLRGNCAIVTAEDETAETIMPRLVAAGADLKKVGIIRKVKVDGTERYLKLPRDLNRLRIMIHNEDLRLLVIDPLNAFVEQSVNTYKDQDIRSVLAPVEGMAEEMRCAILIIAHLNKKEEAATLYRVGGSIGFIGAARSVLGVQKKVTSDGIDMHVLYSLKSNLGKKPPAQQYEIVGADVTEPTTGETIKTSKVEWHGQCADPSRSRDDGPRMRKECLDFLIEEFSREYEVLSDDLMQSAKKAGIPWRTLQEYKHEFKVESLKRHGQWCWKAPDGGFRQFKNAKK